MLAGDFLDLLLSGVAATVTRTQARTLTNIAQNQILGVDNSITALTPYPYLQTAAGVYQYTANGSFFSAAGTDQGAVLTADIRNVRQIIASYAGNVQYWPASWPRPLGGWDGQEDKLNFDCRESAVAGANDCQISLSKLRDPGDSTISWVARVAYRWPNQVASDNTVLEIPDDFCMTLLYDTVMAMIERRQYGRADVTAQPVLRGQQEFLAKYGNPVRVDTPRFSTPFTGR